MTIGYWELEIWPKNFRVGEKFTFGGKIGNFEKKNVFWNNFGNLATTWGKNLDIRKNIGNLKTIWIFVKDLEIGKQNKKLENIWKLGKNFEIWKKI